MFKRIIQVLVSICFISSALNAEIKLYLKPAFTLVSDNTLLSDIAAIEGNYSEIEKIKSVSIGTELYSDGYVDRKEILSLLKYTEENISIYGNAVRVISSPQTEKAISSQNDFLVKKGDRVEIIVLNKGISLMLRGIVLNEGRMNEEILVRPDRSRSVSRQLKGKVKGKDRVEVKL
ncbi:MAG: flagella basal body P-ring formation protein FlgA [Spirochaetota bacterium]